ncbi:TIGR02186 family protein [Tritonibacter horizontis]|uniref:Putative transmembrane protein n=1 Tax=Tritonibacter horizontis TaxID=1768241 RepID=A0A132C1D5_9RHOB|nr:putative transmembrane protein [Tritonibacter horizontis]
MRILRSLHALLASLCAACVLVLVAPFASVTSPAQAEEVVLGLSHDRVAITANFDGSEILIFGAVKRETPIPTTAPLEVIVTVSGPKEPVIVRRKDRSMGIWVNTASVSVDSAPSFYAVATSAPFGAVLRDTEDLRHKISIRRAIRSVGSTLQGAQDFSNALMRIREEKGFYSLQENAVTLDEQTLFRTALQMPADLIEGEYETRIFLTRAGRVVSRYETVIQVNKVGLERFLYNLSQDQPPLYGLLALVIAALSGWGAAALFQMLRNS